MITQLEIYFALDLSTKNKNLSEVSKIFALIGHHAYADCKNIARRVSSQQSRATGSAKADNFSNGTDSTAVR